MLPRMGGDGARTRTWRLIAIAFVLVSIGLHFALLRALPRVAKAPAPRARGDVITLTLETQAEEQRPLASEARTPIASETSKESSAQVVVGRHRAVDADREHESEHAHESEGEQGPAQSAGVEPAPDTSHPVQASDSQLALAPRNAALSTLPADIPQPESDAARAARRGAELSAELRAIANSAPAREHRSPQLTRDADGTCHYAGTAIDATIAPDGGVRFDDRPPSAVVSSVQPLARGELLPRGGVPVPPEHPVTPEEQIPAQQLDFRVRVVAHATEAERAWFLRETTALRRELADGAHARELEQDEHLLRKQLDRIWCDASQPVAERRRALFELWNETSPDEIGRRGRRVVLEYIRVNLPRESSNAYPAAELAALDARRQQRAHFDPYAPETRVR
jgi:hypothetical protein